MKTPVIRTVEHLTGMVFQITTTEPISWEDRKFIRRLAVTIYCNDLTGKLWCFDQKMPSGKWLENIEPSNDLKTATAMIA